MEVSFFSPTGKGRSLSSEHSVMASGRACLATPYSWLLADSCETRLQNSESNRDLAWLGTYLCLVRGVMEVSFFSWTGKGLSLSSERSVMASERVCRAAPHTWLLADSWGTSGCGRDNRSAAACCSGDGDPALVWCTEPLELVLVCPAEAALP